MQANTASVNTTNSTRNTGGIYHYKTERQENNIISFSQSTGEITGEPTGAKLVQPNRQQVKDYAGEIKSVVDPDRFFQYYEERQWEIGGSPINDWKALFRSWDAKEYRKRTPVRKTQVRHIYGSNPVADEDLTEFMRS